MTQAERTVASAMPGAPNQPVNRNSPFSAKLSATQAKPMVTGVRVSPRAKKAGASALTSTKAGRPVA